MRTLRFTLSALAAVWMLGAAGCAAAPDEDSPEAGPVDLTAVVRLRAAAPVLQPLMPWPREAEDAIAAVRDDWAPSAWRAPEGASWIEIDLIPFTGAPVSLDELALDMEDTTPESIHLLVAPSCGGDPVAQISWGDPALPLDLSGTRGGCLRLEAISEHPFTVTGLRVSAQDADLTDPAPPTPPDPLSISPHTDSGVVEGFYGVPWSWRERRNMLHHLSRLGLGVYIYAPKHDPLHRADWREPYPLEVMEAFGDLSELGASVGVRVFFGLSPFVDWEPAGQDDREVLLWKLRAFQDAGIRAFVLLADDIEFDVDALVDGAMGANHVETTNHVLADLRVRDPDAALWFVPTVYSDARADQWDGGLDYLAALADLSPEIQVMWTGPDTSNDTLSGGDFDRVAQLTGRKPVLWENHWANDGGDGFTGRLPLGPYSGRDPSTAGALRGIVANPLIQGATSRLVVTTMSRYLDEPEADVPDSRWAEVAEAELLFTLGAAAGSDRDATLLVAVQALFDQENRGAPGWREMEQRVDALVAALPPEGAVPFDEVSRLLPLFAALTTLPGEVARSGLDPDLDDELIYPLRKARLTGEAGLLGLLTLGDRLRGDASSVHRAPARAAHEAALFSRFLFSEGVVGGLLDAVEEIPAVDLGFVPPEGGEPPPPCRIGQAFSWKPFTACPGLEVFGLPGAEPIQGRLVWEPGLPGRYVVTAICMTSQGWGATTETVICTP